MQKLLIALCLLGAIPLAAAQADVLALALKSQQVLDEYAIGAMEPEAMKYAQRLRRTQAALDAQLAKWPAAGAPGMAACKSALQSASHLAGLSASKAVRAVDEQAFIAEKTRLQQLRSQCKDQINKAP
jgi:hypothetical protein